MRYLELLPGRWKVLAEPFEFVLAVTSLPTGVLAVLGLSRPGALALQLSPWVLHAWGAGLCVAAALTLTARWRLAVAHSDGALETASRLEAMGLVAFAGAFGMYGLAIFAVGLPGLPAGSIVTGWAGACAVRALIITRQWKGHRSARHLYRRRARAGAGDV